MPFVVALIWPSQARSCRDARASCVYDAITPPRSSANPGLGRLVTTVVDWLRRGGTQRTVRLKIGDDELELSGASSTMQQQLAMDWIRAHALEW